MSNKRDRRRKGVIYPGQSGTGRSQNTFFTGTGKEPCPSPGPGLTHEKLDKGTAIMYKLHTGDTNDKAIF